MNYQLTFRRRLPAGAADTFVLLTGDRAAFDAAVSWLQAEITGCTPPLVATGAADLAPDDSWRTTRLGRPPTQVSVPVDLFKLVYAALRRHVPHLAAQVREALAPTPRPGERDADDGHMDYDEDASDARDEPPEQP